MIKYIFALCVVFLTFLIPSTLSAQKQDINTLSQKLKHLKFSKTVVLKSPNSNKTISGSAAKIKLDSFSESINEVTSIHEGYSEDMNSFYGVVQVTSDVSTSRVFYYGENDGAGYKITKLRFNKR